ncbi:hypothetical protein IBX38_06000 [Candidatus Bathyarchaeota archaeon]|nr:hypothetical protein [Candidatus Bathyarchaeota archaeon]
MRRKFKAALGIKGFLCIASLVAIGLALVVYTATVTITPTKMFTIGATTDSWTVYVNDVDQVRYLPGEGTPAGSTTPGTAPDGGSDTYAFKVVTDDGKACAVNITLTTPTANLANFSKFEIRVMYWNTTISPANWVEATIYDAPSGGTNKPYIDGLTGDFGYIQQPISTSLYYLIKVTYSYTEGDSTTAITVTSQYTPLPQ